MRTPMERWQRDVEFLQAINATLSLGPARPIDYLSDVTGWLVIWQGMESLMALMLEDFSSSAEGQSTTRPASRP